MKPLVIAVALALGASLPLQAQNSPATTGTTSAPATPAWVKTSNGYAQLLLSAQAPFQPEYASFFGVPGYDDQVVDLGPNNAKRYREAMAAARTALQAKLASERDPNVRQDLQIMIGAATDNIEGSELNERYLLPWNDAPQLVFSGLNGLLSDQTAPDRRAKALDRLKRYVGLVPGTTPTTTLARQRYEEQLGNKTLLQPTEREVEQALANVDTYVAGIGELFAKYKIAGADEALKAMSTQLKDYASWTRSTVLPKARKDTRLPEPLYAYQLKQVGIDIAPQQLIQRAQLEFMETRSAMRQLAPLVAKAKGVQGEDYVQVIRALKRNTIADDQLETHYRGVIDQIDPIIRQQRIVDVPKRPMQMRLGSAAESAAQPAPHFLPAPLIGNTGQQGQFVLPLGNPSAEGGKKEQYDDFNFGSAAWTLSAHEGRPGHELQFTAMVERGVSLARSMFAFNSVNVEGWALYAEAEMVPYEPLDGQLIALQFRLLRAARAMLDPMLNLGLIDRERARQVLEDDVGLSTAMTRQELDRYTVRAPGQAGSYFYGYTRILELRMRTELALGKKFDRLAFNNFLLDQGLLPPDQLAQAVEKQFIPAHANRGRAATEFSKP
ncbi:DUF885 domain-containing protein [Xanthomonas campestris pv. campestris]|uniref:DUF885 domain-containing protein n=1 Tax=Xanthomonas campestris TaxID=339 RepID=UPI002AD4C5F3|nr:DUF885 domain-containing protein [Xanthomonas campestris]MEA0864166.1 DUF885 domain-containing protein [Xanthomonas campestris pv. campestris]MEB1177873.1 DUF885 domain-containing protein [Xanthomonas campestris pv. campestris]MEB1232033.1 DUF885 domain-containing protein [Xanthomonas campestris pv. campestris]MEB1256813.1 DUF885 domain-containing protein [Xanthomonas campestris pv. campestris]MEB1264762.1 DUF885 domain-containing protein [Xanthomonas campestris pv. campestris]